jgi:TetR/AcrR family transcriptional regulator, transcriptional repressor for nem operon
MRYSKEHKDQVRQQLLLEGARHAKKHGFAASGVDALAGAAGLTTGSLYKHFGNKDTLFSALVKADLAQTVSRFANIKPGDDEAMLRALKNYLSMSHVHAPEAGCPVPSLAADVARASDDVRTVFEAGMIDLKDTLKGILGSDSAAWTLIAQNVGAVMIARAMQHDSIKKEVMNAVRASAARLVSDAPNSSQVASKA